MSPEFDTDYFDAAALTWDDDPAKVDRARAVAAAISAAVPLADVRQALEFGCGTGLVTWELAHDLDHVTLIDTSTGMLAAATDRAAMREDSDQDRFDVRRLDLEAEELPEESFDLIYASMALHHVHEVPLVLTRMHDALRPGGYLAIADLDHDPEHNFHGENTPVHHGFERGALSELITLAGFDSPEFREVTSVTKPVDGQDHEFPVFLAVARRP